MKEGGGDEPRVTHRGAESLYCKSEPSITLYVNSTGFKILKKHDPFSWSLNLLRIGWRKSIKAKTQHRYILEDMTKFRSLSKESYSLKDEEIGALGPRTAVLFPTQVQISAALMKLEEV